MRSLHRVCVIVAAFSVAIIQSSAEGSESEQFAVRSAAGLSAIACAQARSASPSSQDVTVELDAAAFFNDLQSHYRSINLYRDTAHLSQSTRRDGQKVVKIETDLKCSIEAGELDVTTPANQVRDAVGIEWPSSTGPKARVMKQRYDLWLAPHMAMKYADDPLASLQPGLVQPLMPTTAVQVNVNDRRMVHLALRSIDRERGECVAAFDLVINRDSMLIERLSGWHTQPDGVMHLTELTIAPIVANTETREKPATGDSAKPAA